MNIKAVIFDWAGTTVDFGCCGPLRVFVDVFERHGIELTLEEVRAPMGMAKRDHVRALLCLPHVVVQWAERNGRAPNEADVDALYGEFEPAVMRTLKHHCEVLDGVVDACVWLRERGIKIGSTTGYTAEMMRVVAAYAKEQGYAPDTIVTAEDVGGVGRPEPYMLQHNLRLLDIYPPRTVVKVGDTIADIQEGINAGVWSVGVVVGSSVMGMTRDEYDALSAPEQEGACVAVERAFLDAGADATIRTMAELSALIETLSTRPEQVCVPDNPYLLLTPGPLSTTKTVKAAMLRDLCTWDDDYNRIVQQLRTDLVTLATPKTSDYTAVLMQGSGTFAVESVIGSVIPRDGKLLVLTNGAYGDRIVKIAKTLNIDHVVLDFGETGEIDLDALKRTLTDDGSITHIAAVHCETTTGMLNDIAAVAKIVKAHNRCYIVDAMSSFGGIPLDVAELGIDYLVSSANKCIQGVPGFGFVIARRSELARCGGLARSLSLDLFDQWTGMEQGHGKWRFTSPTHVVHAFCQAMRELHDEGGVAARYARYAQNQCLLVDGMQSLGFMPLLERRQQSPIITSFLYPDPTFDFQAFYEELKGHGYVIYPGKISKAQTFRIGNIGDVHPKDIEGLLRTVAGYLEMSSLDNE